MVDKQRWKVSLVICHTVFIWTYPGLMQVPGSRVIPGSDRICPLIATVVEGTQRHNMFEFYRLHLDIEILSWNIIHSGLAGNPVVSYSENAPRSK